MSTVTSPRAKDSVKSAPSRNSEMRSHSESIPSRIIFPDDSSARKSSVPNRDLFSKYCSVELNKLDSSRRPGRYDSAPVRRQTGEPTRTVEEVRLRDVMFLRKMLAINKKQEMMLNKRLARLLEEEEFQNFSEERASTPNESSVIDAHRSRTSMRSSSCKNPVEDLEASPNKNIQSDTVSKKTPAGVIENDTTEKIALPKIVQNYTTEKSAFPKITQYKTAKISPSKVLQYDSVIKITPAKKVQYDINGRRIYYYSDIEKDDIEEGEERQEMNNDASSKRLETSSKASKKGSASSKKTFAMKKSLTYITNQSRFVKRTPVKSKRKVKDEGGDSKSSMKPKNPLDFELRPKKAGCQGDGEHVQNVVVHCSTVFRNSTTSKKKVWNYESLPSLKSKCKGLEQRNFVSSDQTLQDTSECNKHIRSTPSGVRNDNVQIQIKNPPTTKDAMCSTVETVFLVRKKFSDINN